MTTLRGAEGTVLRATCRVFHRSGMQGVHHVEEGVEYIVDESPGDPAPDGHTTLLLTQECYERYADTYAADLDGLVVPVDDPEAHERVVSLEVDA